MGDRMKKEGGRHAEGIRKMESMQRDGMQREYGRGKVCRGEGMQGKMEEGRWKREEGRGKRDEGIGNREQGTGKKRDVGSGKRDTGRGKRATVRWNWEEGEHGEEGRGQREARGRWEEGNMGRGLFIISLQSLAMYDSIE